MLSHVHSLSLVDFEPFPNQFVAHEETPKKGKQNCALYSLAAGFKSGTEPLTFEQPAFLHAVPILISSLSSSVSRIIL